MKSKPYTSINKSTTSGKDSTLKNLIAYYQERPQIMDLTNATGDKFMLFNNGINTLEKDFEFITKEAVKHRKVELGDYLSSGYIVSEINSSLKAEGVHSSRKMVDQVIKKKKTGANLSKDELTKLISNYYEGLNFILGGKEITERNIFTLYSIITADLGDIIEEGCWYRQDVVAIGEDTGIDHALIPQRMEELVNFINSEELNDKIQTKAIIAHYIFENIHPYYDYNGRIGRILHLWILYMNSREEFWKLTFLSEAIYAYKEKLDTTFRKITKAKKYNANIDLTYFISNLYEIFIDHTKAYIKMKNMINTIKSRVPTPHLKFFIIDLLCKNPEKSQWYDISKFKKTYSDYSKTVYDRVLKEIQESNLFDIRKGKPIQFRLKL